MLDSREEYNKSIDKIIGGALRSIKNLDNRVSKLYSIIKNIENLRTRYNSIEDPAEWVMKKTELEMWICEEGIIKASFQDYINQEESRIWPRNDHLILLGRECEYGILLNMDTERLEVYESDIQPERNELGNFPDKEFMISFFDVPFEYSVYIKKEPKFLCFSYAYRLKDLSVEYNRGKKWERDL